MQTVTHKYLLHLSFKGTNYYGWQIQPKSVSIQQVLNHALKTLLREEVNTCGAGRTDKGVHASFFTSHFETFAIIGDNDPSMLFRLNSLLPKDIRIHGIKQVPDDFHARFSATERTYHYVIAREKTCFLNEFSSHVYGVLNVQSMNHAAEMLKEYDDFTSFARLHGNSGTNICKITGSEWFEINGFLVYRICANRFLRNMVRAIVGTLLEVGRDKLSISGFRKVIESRNRSSAGKSADAKGLFLTGITYPEEFNVPQAIKKFPDFIIL